jgi:hypothetical protein
MPRASRPELVAAALLAAAAFHAAAHAGSSVVTTIPFDFVRGAVIVHVTLDGQGPFAMMLDTGADPSIVDIATARTIGMKIAAKGEQGSGGGTNVNLAYETMMNAVTLGSLQATHVAAAAMDLSGIARTLGVPLQGVLGRSLLKGRAFEIDYPKQIVRFFAASASSGCNSLPDTPRRTTLRYRYRDDVLLSGVKINGKPALANLDTGSNSTFQIAPKAVEVFGLAADEARGTVGESTGFNGSARNRTGQVDEVEVGSIAIEHPTVTFAGKATGRDDVRWYVRIGNGFLKDVVLTVDDVCHTVRIEKP